MAYISDRYKPEEKEQSENEKRRLAFAAKLLASKPVKKDYAPFSRRFNDIEQSGVNATNYEMRRRNKREAAELEAIRRKMEAETRKRIEISVGQGRGPDLTPNYTPTIPGSNRRAPNVASPTGDFGAFVNAIASKESGGNYRAVNPDSGAMGKYQIMPGNISGTKRGWDYEALGYDVNRSQFLNSPQIQEAIAQYQLKKYYDKWGPRGAAIAWYAGPGAVSGYSQSALNAPQGQYPSISSYAEAILRRLGL